jgi:hypothetical protein
VFARKTVLPRGVGTTQKCSFVCVMKLGNEMLEARVHFWLRRWLGIKILSLVR